MVGTLVGTTLSRCRARHPRGLNRTLSQRHRHVMQVRPALPRPPVPNEPKEEFVIRTILRTYLVAAGVLLLSGCDPTQRRAGDALLVDKGALAYYPRYRIETEAFVLSAISKNSLYLEALPKSRYSVRLVVESAGGGIQERSEWRSTWEEIDRSGVSVRLEIERPAPEPRLVFSAPLAGGWDPAFGGTESFFHTASLDDVELQGNVTVRIDTTSNGHEAVPKVALRLVFVGGGLRK